MMYLVMIFAPLSGWIAAAGMQCCFGLPGLPDPGALGHALNVNPSSGGSVAYDLHVVLAWSLLALILVHVVAALTHHFVIRDRVLVKMLPGRKPISRS